MAMMARAKKLNVLRLKGLSRIPSLSGLDVLASWKDHSVSSNTGVLGLEPARKYVDSGVSDIKHGRCFHHRCAVVGGDFRSVALLAHLAPMFMSVPDTVSCILRCSLSGYCALCSKCSNHCSSFYCSSAAPFAKGTYTLWGLKISSCLFFPLSLPTVTPSLPHLFHLDTQTSFNKRLHS